MKYLKAVILRIIWGLAAFILFSILGTVFDILRQR